MKKQTWIPGGSLIGPTISLSTVITTDVMDKSHKSENLRTVSSLELLHTTPNIQKIVQN